MTWWGSNWQQDLTPLDHDSVNGFDYHPVNMNGSYFDDEPYKSNITLEHCKAQHANQTATLQRLHPEGFCKVTFDSVLCWPPTVINETAIIKCFSELFNIEYDDTRKFCVGGQGRGDSAVNFPS